MKILKKIRNWFRPKPEACKCGKTVGSCSTAPYASPPNNVVYTNCSPPTSESPTLQSEVYLDYFAERGSIAPETEVVYTNYQDLTTVNPLDEITEESPGDSSGSSSGNSSGDSFNSSSGNTFSSSSGDSFSSSSGDSFSSSSGDSFSSSSGDSFSSSSDDSGSSSCDTSSSDF